MHLQPNPLPVARERTPEQSAPERLSHEQAHLNFLRALQQEAQAAEMHRTSDAAPNEHHQAR
ncbi:hypothetical protein [Hydrogenophaga sp.]|uniref:hypothetical protein n=1 Tax=Hydrogenophaga sp. TaxID=1904254 RepID=UPI00261B8C9C|nr:hypothetical protein [Hydrogenophaga sp.]